MLLQVQSLIRALERGSGNEAEKEVKEQRHTSRVTRHTSHVTRHTSQSMIVNVFLLLRLERKLSSKAFTAPHHRPDPDAAPDKTPLEIAEEKREALMFLAG